MKEALCQIATYSSRTGKSNLWFGGKNLNIFVPKEKGKVGNRINREGDLKEPCWEPLRNKKRCALFKNHMRKTRTRKNFKTPSNPGSMLLHYSWMLLMGSQ